MFWGSLSQSDRALYWQKLKGMSTADLRKEETKNIQSRIGSVSSMGTGLGMSISTFGFSLVDIGVAGYKNTKARNRLELIQAELRERNEQPRDSRAADFIPIAPDVTENIIDAVLNN